MNFQVHQPLVPPEAGEIFMRDRQRQCQCNSGVGNPRVYGNYVCHREAGHSGRHINFWYKGEEFDSRNPASYWIIASWGDNTKVGEW